MIAISMIMNYKVEFLAQFDRVSSFGSGEGEIPVRRGMLIFVIDKKHFRRF